MTLAAQLGIHFPEPYVSLSRLTVVGPYVGLSRLTGGLAV